MEITKNRLVLTGAIIILLIIAFIAGGFFDILKPQKPCPAIARICNDGSTANLSPDCTHICPEDSL